VALSSTRPGDKAWDPGTVEAGAERAVDDPTVIAYLGELDLGASAVSLPVTNRDGLLQVSPADGLTSLTTAPPGRPRAGPERYYPEERRSFVRLVPTDLEVAEGMLAELPTSRRVAVVHTEGFAERELTGMLAYKLRRSGTPALLVEPAREDPDARRSLVEDLVAKRPAAILLAAANTPAARGLLTDLARRLPGVPVVAGPPLAAREAPRRVPARTTAITGVLPPRVQPPAGRRLLRSLGEQTPEALYGYDAMELALDAIEAGGPDRRKVAAAALRPRRRTGVTGRYAVRRDGTAGGRRLAIVDLGAGRVPVRVVVP
jgi:branched-chain amino acid transport system substrate-binding protein